MIPQQNDITSSSRGGNSQPDPQLDNIKTKLENAEKEINKLKEKATQQQNEYKELEIKKNNIDDKYKKLKAEQEEQLEAMKPFRVLYREAEKLCEKYSILEDNAITEKQQIKDQLSPFFHLVHYAEDSKDLFEYAGHRNRIDSDPLGIDKIETCPALLISKNEKCISKGKYVVLVDQDKQ